MNCKCGTDFQIGAEYCYKCGRKLPEMLKIKKVQQVVIKQVPAVLTIEQLAELLMVSRTTVYDLIRKEGLPCFSVGTRKRFNTQAVLEWITQKQLTEKTEKAG